MTKIYDISQTVNPTLAVWPGDTQFSAEQQLDLQKGDAVNLLTLHLSAHTGTHIDAPFHYVPETIHPADLPLNNYIGSAQVVTITRQSGGIVPEDLAHYNLAKVARILIHTWVSDNSPHAVFPEDFPYPTVELIDWLADKGCILFGVDMPSVDKVDSKELPCHHRLFAHQILNIENLNLAGVPDGEYELIALPLKIEGVCGSPVRAILREI